MCMCTSARQRGVSGVSGSRARAHLVDGGACWAFGARAAELYPPHKRTRRVSVPRNRRPPALALQGLNRYTARGACRHCSHKQVARTYKGGFAIISIKIRKFLLTLLTLLILCPCPCCGKQQLVFAGWVGIAFCAVLNALEPNVWNAVAETAE